VLDPPKFVHSAAQINAGSRGYKDINLLGLKLVRPGGHLATFSCSGAVTPEIFQRTWGERSWPTDGSPPVDTPFWPETIGRVKAKNPGFIFMAEVYWDLEWTLMQQGFDYCYDKSLYDRLLSRDAGSVRAHLWADMAYQNKLARFLENHDEPRAAHDFPVPVHQAAAIITYLTPGLRFFHEGQLEGRRVKVSMHLGRRPEEPVDPVLQEFYGKLLACLKRPEVREGHWQLLDVHPAWDGNHSWDRFLAFAWEGDNHQRLLITVNYGPAQGQCHVAWPFVGVKGKKVTLKDLVHEAQAGWTSRSCQRPCRNSGRFRHSSRKERNFAALRSNWRNRFRHEGRAVPADAKNPENWSGENKLAVVIETAALNEEQLAEYCRKKGLYVEQIARWREAAIAGAETLKPLSAEERRELELSTCCRAGQSFCIKRTAPSAPRTASFLATFLISETASRRRWHASLDARQP